MLALVYVRRRLNAHRRDRRARAGWLQRLLLAQLHESRSHICSAHLSDDQRIYWKHHGLVATTRLLFDVAGETAVRGINMGRFACAASPGIAAPGRKGTRGASVFTLRILALRSLTQGLGILVLVEAKANNVALIRKIAQKGSQQNGQGTTVMT